MDGERPLNTMLDVELARIFLIADGAERSQPRFFFDANEAAAAAVPLGVEPPIVEHIRLVGALRTAEGSVRYAIAEGRSDLIAIAVPVEREQQAQLRALDTIAVSEDADTLLWSVLHGGQLRGRCDAELSKLARIKNETGRERLAEAPELEDATFGGHTLERVTYALSGGESLVIYLVSAGSAESQDVRIFTHLSRALTFLNEDAELLMAPWTALQCSRCDHVSIVPTDEAAPACRACAQAFEIEYRPAVNA